jgi:NAD(P)-dependent dehydrogenase (short-subunit alcohol dehydrogenase family)
MMTGSSNAALVTGASRRIGRAIALDLANHGWAVAVHFNGSGEDAAEVVATITERGQRAVAVAADLADEEATTALVGRAAEAIGPLSCLINNASIFENDTVATATRDSWDRHLAVNLRAPFVLAQSFAGQLPNQASGNIINIIDQRVWNLTPHFMSYTVSKAGLWTLTQTLALALAPGIRVNAIGPGPTLPSPRQSDEQFNRQWAAQPLARPVSPDEIAGAIRFILDAPAMTGQMIALDAGQHLSWRPGIDGEDDAE